MKPWQATLIGHVILTPAVLAAMIAPITASAFISASAFADDWPTGAHIALLIIGFVLAPLLGWLVWSWGITRWRLWAYRQVGDVQALKAAAAAGSLVWPEGHLAERTEIRFRDQALELEQLEAAADQRRSQTRTEK